MKKIIFAIVAVLIPVAVFAQRGIPRSNNVSVSSTIVTKKKSIVSRQGFQQSLELGTKLDLREEYKGTTGVNYIGGYRFNSHFFAGIGVGLECAHFVAKGVKENVGKNAFLVSESWSLRTFSELDVFTKRELGIPDTRGMDNAEGSLNRIAVPLYLHLKGYYTKTKCAPYSSLSIGGFFAPKENGLYADFSTGVSVRLNDKNSVYFAAGVWYRRVRDTFLEVLHVKYETEYHGPDRVDSACTIGYSHTHLNIYNLFSHWTYAVGLSLRVGFSF